MWDRPPGHRTTCRYGILERAALLCLALAAACVFDRSGIGHGTSNNNDFDGGKPDASCENGDARCNGTVLEVCGANGWELTIDCPLDCNAVERRCNRVRPSNGINPAWVDEGQNPFNPQALVVVNTETGDIDPPPLNFPVWYVGPYECGQGGNHMMEAAVFGFSEIHIPAGVTVRVLGTRAAVFLASGPVVIEGIIELSGGRDACPEPQQPYCAGPGGFEGGRSAAENPQSGFGPGGGGAGYSLDPWSNDETGGGGGGHAATGGWGGHEDDDDSLPGGAGGEWYGSTPIEPLCGGSGGGGGGGGINGGTSSHGGGGGGALQILSATSIVIECNPGPCGIHASGAGGQADHATDYNDGGGGGGGGGAILLEAPSFTLGDHGYLVAGGGGGAGGYNNGADCNDGQDGPFSGQQALGGFGNYSGGNGGGANVGPGDHGDAGHDGTAGGGGAAGRIRINHNNDADIRGTASPRADGFYTFGAILTY